MACWMRGRKRDLPCWKPLESNMEEIREVESHTSFKKRWSMKEIMREKNPGNALWKGLNKLKELSCRSFLCSSAFRDKKCWRTQPQCAGKDLSREGSQMWKFNSANTNHIDFPQQYSRQWLPKLYDFPYQSNRKKSNDRSSRLKLSFLMTLFVIIKLTVIIIVYHFFVFAKLNDINAFKNQKQMMKG